MIIHPLEEKYDAIIPDPQIAKDCTKVEEFTD